ncbi:MAG: Ig-like domain-containing protein [Marinilabiliales bacterium]|nr:Ig-like domain-containing protein [Marinilabiliales bacterium]
MKILRYVPVLSLVFLLLTGCNKGIDPISKVDPGPDQSSPVVTIKYPLDGTKIQVPELITSINIQFEATDDIELKSVTVAMDGTNLVTYSEFKDYRRAVKEYNYDKVTNGNHTLTITAVDLGGKSTVSTVKFEKKPPYIPIYAGEVFYMPFDGDYVEKISFKAATKVGSPGFAGTSLKGLNAYAGATDGYLTFPMAGLKSPEFSVEFWYKLKESPDRSGIISISPSGEDRTKGVRFFREGSATSQRFKLNVGTGSSEVWNDGGVVNAPNSKWIHLAFTVSQQACAVYINGALAASVPAGIIDWTGCESMTIASGAPNFVYWDHKSDLSYYDEMRIFNRALSPADIQTIIQNDSPYVAKYSGEVFYMPFEGNAKELISNTSGTTVGAPTYVPGKVGMAYAGATNAYLTFPTTNLKNASFSAVCWLKVNASPDRAGILVMSPPDTNNPSAPNNRTSGFRFFREGSATAQIFKLNAGNGTADSWFDGGATATIDPTAGSWFHMAFTITAGKCVVYINGNIVKQDTFSSISWTGCDLLSIMSGVPRFTEWGHNSDLSLMDELRIFNKALSQDEVVAIYNAEK